MTSQRRETSDRFWLTRDSKPAALLPRLSLPALDDEFRRAVVRELTAGMQRIAAEAVRNGAAPPDLSEALAFGAGLSGGRMSEGLRPLSGAGAGELVTLGEVLERTGEALSASTLKRWLASGELTARRVPWKGKPHDVWLVLWSDVERRVREKDER